jgi:hypothetical protein
MQLHSIFTRTNRSPEESKSAWNSKLVFAQRHVAPDVVTQTWGT